MSGEMTLHRGAVVAITQHRSPYTERPRYKARALDQSPDSYAAMLDLLSQASSENTASTSELLGAVRMLEAMARAVRNRSYVVMAACLSSSGAPAFLSASSLESKASVRSFTAMGISIYEVTWSEDGIAPSRPKYAFQGLTDRLARMLDHNAAPGEGLTVFEWLTRLRQPLVPDLVDAMHKALQIRGFKQTRQNHGRRLRVWVAPTNMNKGGAS